LFFQDCEQIRAQSKKGIRFEAAGIAAKIVSSASTAKPPTSGQLAGQRAARARGSRRLTNVRFPPKADIRHGWASGVGSRNIVELWNTYIGEERIAA
jgi:hypothetical protein